MIDDELVGAAEDILHVPCDWLFAAHVTLSGRTQRGRGRMRQVHQHGAAGDQTRATVNHPAEDTEPDDPEWHEINWQPKNIPFTENPGPIGDAAALESEQPVDFTKLFISNVLIQNIVDQTTHTDPKNRLNVSFAVHELVPILSTPKKQHPTRGCRVCVRKGLRKETSFYCKSCGVPLHPGKCYSVYHSKANYSA